MAVKSRDHPTTATRSAVPAARTSHDARTRQRRMFGHPAEGKPEDQSRPSHDSFLIAAAIADQVSDPASGAMTPSLPSQLAR